MAPALRSARTACTVAAGAVRVGPMPARTARLLLATAATGAAAVIAGGVLWVSGEFGPSSTFVVEPVGDGDPAPPWRGQQAFAVDAVAGVRPRRSCVVQVELAALGELEPVVRTKHRDADGFLRRQPVPEPADRPVVLLLGDSHVDGVVDTEANVGSLLEQRLTDTGSPCYVQNAACGFHGLWQYALRARELVPRLRPAVVVVVVFLGNDLIDLDQTLLPHLDDTGREQAPHAPTDSAAVVARMRRLRLPAADAQLFWQGLNQAECRRQRPPREAAWLTKAGHAVDALQATAAAAGSRVVWVLLPSFDLVFPECVAALGGPLRVVAASGAQRSLERGFRLLLGARGIEPVDVEAAFRLDGHLSLYAVDYHIDRRGHERLAEIVEAPLRRALGR